MHRCCFTCFKYADKNGLGEKVCRSMFPFEMGVASNEQVTFLKKRQKKNIRMHVLPKRNNAHLNNTSKSPLLAIAHGANRDIKYIDTPHGSAQYCASYISKG